MTAALTDSRNAAPGELSPAAVGAATDSSTRENRPRPQRVSPARPGRYSSDDEILGIESAAGQGTAASQPGSDVDPLDGGAQDGENSGASFETERAPQVPENLQAALDANPELRRAWEEAQSYRESFATPDEARAATALLSDLDRMDALFFSRRPEDHAELARAVANLDPDAFTSLARAMNSLAANEQKGAGVQNQQQIPRTPSLGSEDQSKNESARDSARNDNTHAVPTPAQIEFLHAANAAVVQGVIDAIETQVDRLLPDGVSKSARNRVVGEIYRELDASMGSNRQLGQQMRDAFRSGGLDATHQRAVVALVTGRARQALPGIAKRVLNEWTSTVVAANQDRLARQRAAAHRVDIAGSGGGADGGRRSLGPRDIDYARMSDSDILNL